MYWLQTFIRGVLIPCCFHFSDASIDCFTCASRNNSNPNCTDPFHPAYNTLSVKCRQARDGRMGVFPAKYCTKIKGTSSRDNTEIYYRSCALEKLENMCGQFELEGVFYTGCVLSCAVDACNSGNVTNMSWSFVSLTICILIVISHRDKNHLFCNS